MNVVNTNSVYRIYDDHLSVTPQLPPKQYVIRCGEMTGFFLEEYADPCIYEEKIYGIHERKASKVLSSFADFNRNLGVILSGDKGIGKSLFAKLLAKRAITNNLAVILVDTYYRGIHSFLESIEQEVVVIFDEFEKTFKTRGNNNESHNPMDTMLTLFDGMSVGKKLFIVTCNSFESLNDFMINRPGRFHYHFRFDYPSGEEVREYLLDKLGAGYEEEIEKVVNFSARVSLNFDCLRAIAYELGRGETFADAILDLNIINITEQRYSVECVFADGEIMYLKRIRMDIFSNTPIDVWLEDAKGNRTAYRITFVPGKAEYISYDVGSLVRGDNVTISVDPDYFYDNNNNRTDKVLVDAAINRPIKHVLLKRIIESSKYSYKLS